VERQRLILSRQECKSNMVKYSLVNEASDSASLEYDAEASGTSSRKFDDNSSGHNNCRCGDIGERLLLFCGDCCGIDPLQNDVICTKVKKYIEGFVEVIFGLNYCYWFQVIIHNKFCDFLFKCGCTWEWDGGWKDCNVHNSEGPRCPWCCARTNISWTTDYMLTALMMITYIYLLSRRKKSWIGHPFSRFVAPILVYFISGVIVGACFLVGGYPHFVLW
jgi:hypothetical protein